MDIRPLNFPGSQESMKDHYSLHIGSKRKTTTGAFLQNPNGQHEIQGVHSTELPFPDYISWYVKDRLAGKITCMVCGEEGHYTCDCSMKDREEKVICILCNRVGHCHLWCCRNNVSENQACRRCGEKGHYSNKGLDEKYTKSNLSCSSCDISHPLGECPMGKITCFLCEGEDHVPAQCHLSPVLTVITQVHRESFRAAVEQAMAEKSRRTVTTDKQSREIELYDESPGCLLTTVAREDEPLTVVPRVTCFNCNYEGHYANQCPKKTQLGELEQYDVTCSNFQANRCRKKMPRLICFNCNYEGHYADQCPKKPQLGVEQYDVTFSNFQANRYREKTSGALELCDITCFNCNDKGHYARNCSKEKPPRELVTYGDNHGYQSKGGSGMAPNVSSFSRGVQDQCDNMSPIRRQIPATTGVELTRVQRVICFNCHDVGHSTKMCPREKAPKKLGRVNINCLFCNGKHYTIRCPKRLFQKQKRMS